MMLGGLLGGGHLQVEVSLLVMKFANINIQTDDVDSHFCISN